MKAPARRLAFGVALVCVLAGCPGEGRERPTGDGTIRVVHDAEDADVLLHVSNQSFEHDEVGIVVTLDGVRVVDEDVPVEGQHHWVEFPLVLPAGEYTLTAASSTEVTEDFDLTVPEGERRWVVLDYWFPDTVTGQGPPLLHLHRPRRARRLRVRAPRVHGPGLRWRR